MADKNTWQVIQTAPFIRGLNTEINDLQDATQYTSDELNMVIKNNGTRARRLGIDYEEGFKYSKDSVPNIIEVEVEEEGVLVTKQININPVFTAFEWTDITDSANVNYLVVQAGGTLYFYYNLGAPFSQAQTIYSINLADYKLSEDPEDVSYAEEPVSYANAYGGLFVCSKAIKPFVLINLKEDPDEPAVAPTAVVPFNRFFIADSNFHWANWGDSDYNPEVCFKIDGVTVGVSQLFGTADYYYSLNADAYNTAAYVYGPFFGQSSHNAEEDDYGTQITEQDGVVQLSSNHKTVIRTPSAKYYADLWNYWRDLGLTRGISCKARTPFDQYWSDTTDVIIANNGYYFKKIFFKKETVEYLEFICPSSISYENLTISLEYVPRGYFEKNNYIVNALGWHTNPVKIIPIPLVSSAITQGYKTPNVQHTIDVQIRDFVGLADIYHDANLNKNVDLNSGEGLSTCPDLPTNIGGDPDLDSEITAHCYNLFNQGWNKSQLDAYKALDTRTVDNVSYSVYPSNNYQWFLSKDPSTKAFKPADLIKIAFGNTRAPNGRSILTFLKQDRKAAINSVSDPDERINVGDIDIVTPRTPYFSDIIAYAGRIWYLSGDTILYSQVLLDDINKADKCYQEADPTSETLPDLVDTDGGMIQIPELGEGIRFCLVGAALVAVGTKSIQLISGGQNNAFTATAYVRGAMQSYSSIAPRSFVTTEYGTFFWSDVGIIMLSYQEGFQAQNITESTINTFYQRIPDEAKKKCVGIYNRAQKQIVWMYPSDPAENNLNKMLVLDILKSSWTPFEITSTAETEDTVLPWVVGGISLLNSYKVDSIYPVYAEVVEEVAPNVFINATEPIVVVDENEENNGRILVDDPVEREEKTFKSATILCFDRRTSKFTFGNFDNLNCLDWASADIYGPGVNYNSYLVSHPINLDSTAYNKTIPYLLSYFRRTETGYTTNGVKIYPSACQGAVLWDWNNSGKAGKWDAQQELYRYERDTLLDNEYVFSKTRIYGGGRAFQVKLSSKDNNYFIVENIGFNIYGDARI